MCECDAVLEDDEALLDHQTWCTGDAAGNRQLVAQVLARQGSVTYEALLAAAHTA